MKLNKIPAVLLLEDGTAFHGISAGKIGTTTGEICFTTGMTGYQEIFTDPSFTGQILIMTHVHIGNYGVNKKEVESSSVKIAGLVCKTFSDSYSRPMADHSLQEYFLEQNIIGISDLDTRLLVRHIRNKGAMNAIISSEETDLDKLKQKLSETPSMAGLELSSTVTIKESYHLGNAESKRKVAVLDLGVKKNILDCLTERDCYLKVFPAKTPYEEMEKWSPDGFFISNGPGDPAAMDYAVNTVRQIIAYDKPMFGICLGHQLLARANDISTYKMHFGHRGLNHPVKNIINDTSEITTQNHGFGVSADDIKNSDRVEVTHLNLNDNSIEGIRVKGKKAFSVQYHPESTPGPHDSRYLFDEFIEMMNSNN